NKGSDPNDQSSINDIELYNTMSTNEYLGQKWAWVYMMSKRSNLALQVLEKVEGLKEDVAKMRKGELKFLRSLAYFEAMRVFGVHFPYIDESRTENDPKTHNDKDIFSQVLADVDDAIANLSDDPSVVVEIGRVNKSAAKALKAKMLVWHGDLAEARPILEDVLTNGVTTQGVPYGLEDDLDNNFNALTENGKESIFAVQYSNAA
ncbi:RagB/SusD domain-containing protein, partial [gut metagenome]